MMMIERVYKMLAIVMCLLVVWIQTGRRLVYKTDASEELANKFIRIDYCAGHLSDFFVGFGHLRDFKVGFGI